MSKRNLKNSFDIFGEESLSSPISSHSMTREPLDGELERAVASIAAIG